MKRGLLDPTFRYVRAEKTDIRKTFARVRRELAAAPAPRVVPLAPVKAKR